jgi:hypothetical protein
MSDVSGPGSVFGGGLDTQSGAPAYSGDGSGSLPDTPITPNVGPAPAAPPSQASTPTFGSSFVSPFPNYNTPDPAATALDQTSGLLQQRITRANQIATNPLAQIFAPESVQAARDAVPKMTEQLQQIQTQKAAVQAGRAQAQTLGLTPGEAPDQATQEDRLEIASNKALKGDLRAFQGIQAVAPDKAAALAPQVIAAVGGHLDNAQRAFDSLSGMENEGQYQAKTQQLRSEGTLTDLESAGLKLPPTFDAFKAAAPSEALALRNARAALNAQGQAVEARNTYVPMETKEQDTYKGALKTVYGDELNLGPWSRNGASGTRGQLANGIATVDDYGKTGGGATADQRKQLTEAMAAAVPKQDIEKYRAFNRIYQVATTDAKGNALPAGQINTNPNVQQGIAEGLASMLRGGTGGANVGLLRIEGIKRGAMQSLFDTITSNYAGTLNTLSADQVRPYLTQLTQTQVRDVMDVLKGYNDSSISDRTAGIARRAGALGLDTSALGLGQDEASGPIADAIEEGRKAQVERMRPYFQPIGAGNGVLQLGAQRPGAGAISLPPGSQTANQLPNAQPLLTPVQQAGTNPGAGPPVSPSAPPAPQPPNSNGAGTLPPNAPAPQNPTAPNGGQPPQPLTIAGQQVNVSLPPGASSAYVASLQRIETGNERSPWTATTKSTSAGGAFQAVKGTWDQFKPAGAPEQAKDATPQQQADFLSRLTTANAASLQTAGVPVNDTSLYVAHNLGAAGAAALLRANPNADARTVVGETAAKNNSRFFKGRPTVATVLQRYADATGGTVPQPSAAPGQQPASGNPMDDPAAMAWNQLTPEQQEQGRQGGTQMLEGALPAAGSTVGSLIGSRAGLPGQVIGGAIGGGGGQVLKDYLQGNPQSKTKIAEQAALGGLLGVVPEGRLLTKTGLGVLAGQTAGSAAIEAGTEAAQGGNAADTVDAGLRGGAEGLGGRLFGHALGMGLNKVYSLFTPAAQRTVQAAAKDLHEANQTLATTEPKLPGEGAGDNPKYVAAQAAKEKAEATIKDMLPNAKPDEVAYAHKVTSEDDVPRGEAVVMGRAQSAASETSRGYNQLRQDVQNTGVGVPKANQPLPDGPVAQIRTPENPTGPVEPKFTQDAQFAEMKIKAPAPDWGTKWQQLQQAGTELIDKRLTFIANGDEYGAKQMDKIFQGVRNQQTAAAKYVFGPDKAPQVINRLEQLDKSWATVMTGSGGLNYGKMQQVLQSGNTPQARAMATAFKSFAGDDPGAMRAFNAMKAGAPADWKMMIPVVASEAAVNMAGVPTLGGVSAAAAATLGGQRLYRVMRQYMNAKVLGQPVQFKDFFMKDLQDDGTLKALGNVAQRGAVQGDVLGGAAQGAGASP